jgi:hypothetical protein
MWLAAASPVHLWNFAQCTCIGGSTHISFLHSSATPATSETATMQQQHHFCDMHVHELAGWVVEHTAQDQARDECPQHTSRNAKTIMTLIDRELRMHIYLFYLLLHLPS